MEWQLGGGVIVLVAVLLWLLYLLPSWHSRHQYNASERNAVRLNQALRVLAETSETPGEVHLELNARTAAAQQRLARRAKAAEAEAELEEARRQLEVARSLPGARRARARRRARALTTFVGLSALGLAGWGAWEVVTTGSQLALWAGAVVAGLCGSMLTRMARVRGRAGATASVEEPVVHRTVASADLHEVLDDRGWTPRALPRPLVASAGSRAASELDAVAARQALLDAARRDELRVRAEELRPAVPDIAAARAARAEESPFSRMGYVDDAEIEEHVRQLLARPRRGLTVFYEPADRDRAVLPHDPFKAIIAPRPIGWISTIGPYGATNLAPYSFFNAVADRPPMVMFSSAGMKDSATFAVGTGEFVWNLVTWDLRERMNASSAKLPRGESEFDVAGVTPVPSRLVSPPRVGESPVALECRVSQTLTLTDAAGNEIDRHVVIGQVVGVHIDERFVSADGRVDTAGLRPVARGGYLDEYSVVDEVFHMARPR